MRNFSGHRGRGSVNGSKKAKRRWRKKEKKYVDIPPAAFMDKCTFFEAADFASLVTGGVQDYEEKKEEYLEQKNKEAREELSRLRAWMFRLSNLVVSGWDEDFLPFDMIAYAKWRHGLSEADWETEISAKVRGKLEPLAGGGNPRAMMKVINARQRKQRSEWGNRKTPPELTKERALLHQLHLLLKEGAARFADDLQDLYGSEEFANWGDKYAGFSRWRDDFNKEIASITACRPSNCWYNHAAKAIHLVADRIKRNLKKIDKRLGSEEPFFKSGADLTVDLTGHLNSINSISYWGHEVGLVKLRDFDDLLDEAELPRGGFVAAYNPLNGNPFFERAGALTEQFFTFESRSSLDREIRDGKKITFTGILPFQFRRVKDNMFPISLLERQNGKLLVKLGVDPKKGVRSGAFKGVLTVNDDDILGGVAEEGPHPFRHLCMYPNVKHVGDQQGKAAKQRLWVHGPEMYVNRAVPFVTMKEAQSAFTSVEFVKKNLELMAKADSEK